MAIYPGTPTIRTAIKTIDNKSMTQVWRNDELIRVVETDSSQIRPERMPMLWAVPVKEQNSIKGGADMVHY